MKRLFMIAAVMGMVLAAKAANKNVVAASEKESEERMVVVTYRDAMFPGGEKACTEWIDSNLKYPAGCIEDGVTGVVLVSFVVESDGSISDIRTISDTDERLNSEVVRVVSAMPRWEPGTANEVPTRARYTLPIRFELPR